MRVKGCVHGAVLLSLAACGGKSPAERIAEHDLERTSWEQTTQLVGEKWIASQIPTAYAHRTLVTALQELAAQNRAIGSESIDDSSRARLQLVLARSKKFTERLDSAIADDDSSAAVSVLERAVRRGAK
jgi:hypothetical protein